MLSNEEIQMLMNAMESDHVERSVSMDNKVSSYTGLTELLTYPVPHKGVAMQSRRDNTLLTADFNLRKSQYDEYAAKSRRDNTLLTVDFNLRMRDSERSPQSPAWDDTLLVSNIKQCTL